MDCGEERSDNAHSTRDVLTSLTVTEDLEEAGIETSS
jgi:hypothetical protein